MGYVLLGIENLIVALLLLATAFALIGRLHRRWLRIALWMPLVLLLMLVYASAAALAATLNVKGVAIVGDFWGVPLLSIAFFIGCIALMAWGLRRDTSESAPTVAGRWPRGKLSIALAVAAVLNAMTFWNMDLAARQQLDALRGEAGALALSVAPARVLDRDNAAILYERAFDGLFSTDSKSDPPHEQWDAWTGPDASTVDPNDAELRQFLQRNAGRIALLHKAASKPGCYFEHDYSWPTIDMLLPEVSPMRDGARLLALDARVKAADGDTAGTLQDISSIFAMSQHVGTCPTLISMVVAIAMDQLAARSLEDVLADGTVSPKDLASFSIDDSTSYHRIFERDLRMEQAFRLASYCQVGTGELDLRNLCGDDKTENNLPNGWIVVLFYRVFGLPNDLADERWLSRQLNRVIAKPFYEAAPELKEFNQRFDNGTTGLLTRMLYPSLGSCYDAVARGDALRQAVLAGLAAERFRAKNDRIPIAIEELVPDFLPTLPRDPFDGKPLRMGRSDRSLIFYSIGPDKADNHGDPFEHNSRAGDISFKIPVK